MAQTWIFQPVAMDSLSVHGQVTRSGFLTESITRLTVPSGGNSAYRIAQLDDYSHRRRKDYLYAPPISLALDACVSSEQLPGTWGFGFWNDPFAVGMGIKGSGLRLPALPEAAWFFYGSAKNDLSFQSRTAVNGLTASVYASINLPSALLPLVMPGLLLLPFKPTARLIRHWAARVIYDSQAPLETDPTGWHTYRIDWRPASVQFFVDGVLTFSSRTSPRPPLGMVIWMDNQFAVFSADGSLRFGLEANPEAAWLEIKNVQIAWGEKP